MNYTEEYRISKGWKVFMGIFCLGMLAGGAYLLTEIALGNQQSATLKIITGLVLIPLSFYFFMETLSYEVKITGNEIWVRDFGKPQSLPLNEIKGYKFYKGIAFIHPKSDKLPILKVSDKIENHGLFITWLTAHYKDIDKETAAKEEQEILHDEGLGADVAARKSLLEKTRRVVSWLNTAGLAISIWAMIYPKPYELACGCCLAIILLALIPYYRNKGLVKLIVNDKSAYPNLSTAVLLPAAVFFMRALIDYSIINFSPLWLPALALCLFFAGILISGHKEFDYRIAGGWASIIMITAVAYIFGMGICIFYNCYFDSTAPQVSHPVVISKRYSSGRHTSYYFTVKPWSAVIEQKEIEVYQSLYNRVSPGQTVNVYTRKGNLNAAWYDVSDK
ncbi:MAG TPA: hypothetical protein VG603_00690 [Chitinophagales bacterium]|nr:hypothetical protein [Chitinophagales bacterium]